MATKKDGHLNSKPYKSTFEKISDDKRTKILEVAIDEFSKKGFNSANINDISKNAGISIGSMYTYFASKEDLFLTVINYGYELLEDALQEIALARGDVFDKLEKMFRFAQKYSKKYKKVTQIYLDITSESLAQLSRKLSRKMETITARYYWALIKEGKEQGLIDKKLDERIASFCIDNMILILQFSYTAEYYKERMKIFAGDNSLAEDEKMIKGIMYFLKGALSPRG